MARPQDPNKWLQKAKSMEPLFDKKMLYVVAALKGECAEQELLDAMVSPHTNFKVNAL